MTRELNSRTINSLANIATFHSNDEYANKAMRLLKKIDPTYHWCQEFDDLVICSSDDEAKFCNCLNV